MRPVSATLIVLAAVAFIGIFAYVNTLPREQIVDLRGQKNVAIVLKKDGFEPRDVRVTRGAIVTFTTERPNKFWPASNAHPAHDV
ncbi:MAG: hypothetical protein Athens041674_2 [Parcubacteria group bacterium Athens0416_74]|nr:MAG: hypothetical protein Athens041674_2 [Parcubacteria group bacterium Athens0416_74]